MSCLAMEMRKRSQRFTYIETISCVRQNNGAPEWLADELNFLHEGIETFMTLGRRVFKIH